MKSKKEKEHFNQSSRPRKQQIVAEYLSSGTISENGGAPQQVTFRTRAIATTQDAVDPAKAKSALWDISYYNVDRNMLQEGDKGLSYQEAREFLLRVQFNAAGRNVDPAHLTAEDQAFIQEQRPKLLNHNIFNKLG